MKYEVGKTYKTANRHNLWVCAMVLKDEFNPCGGHQGSAAGYMTNGTGHCHILIYDQNGRAAQSSEFYQQAGYNLQEETDKINACDRSLADTIAEALQS